MPNRHPTILIGYDTFGASVLQRLLGSAAPRGALAWEDRPESAEGGAKQLKDLGLVWIADPAKPALSTTEGHLIKDLYSQIRRVDAGPGAREDLKRAVVEIKEKLIDESRLMQSSDRLRLGLDVIVIAQPSRVEIIGRLEDLLHPVMDALADDRSLRRPAQGADLLNFSAILDFDRYWSADSAALRRELQASVLRWKQRQAQRKPSFARIYLADGQTPSSGRRPEKVRVEEIVLLLEFLLLEGVRDQASLRRLYQREADDSEPLAAFAIRLVERSRGLLSRIAAAKFAYGWLDHMAGPEAPGAGEIRATLRTKIAGHLPSAASIEQERDDVDKSLQQGLRRLQDELVEFTRNSAEDSRWPESIRDRAIAGLLELKTELTAWAGRRASAMIHDSQEHFSADLREAVTAALHDASHAAPLGAVIAELQSIRKSLEPEVQIPAETPPVDAGDAFAGVDEIHGRFLRFCHLQLGPANLQRILWPLLAVMAAVAWTPSVVEALAAVPPPDPASAYLLRILQQGLAAFANPLWIAPLIATAAWAAGRFVFHQALARRVEKGRLKFLHPQQGELTDRVRDAVALAAERAPITLNAEELLGGMLRRVRGEALREITRAIDRLTARQHEVRWLRQQFREFLRSYGVDADLPPSRVEFRHDQSNGYRFSLERENDLRRILARNPATQQRFQSTQGSRAPFEDWDSRYCGRFLYPVHFLDDLSEEYHQHANAELLGQGWQAEAAERASELRDFIHHQKQFPVGMDWGQLPGVTVNTEAFCLIPELWLQLEGVLERLSEEGYTRERTLVGEDPDRAYLLRIQLNVDAHRLVDGLDVMEHNA
jgi:hypothetical protein